MVLDFDEIAKLQYHHVNVITSIREGRDLKSEFTQSNFKSIKPDDKIDNHVVFVGYLYIIDPITKATILCLIEEEKVVKNIIISGHSIFQIIASSDNNTLPSNEVKRIIARDRKLKSEAHQHSITDSTSDEEILRRRDSIVTLLSSHRIPIRVEPESNVIVVADSARLKPPYKHEFDYICPTRIVLKRIKHLVDSICDN